MTAQRTVHNVYYTWLTFNSVSLQLPFERVKVPVVLLGRLHPERLNLVPDSDQVWHPTVLVTQPSTATFNSEGTCWPTVSRFQLCQVRRKRRCKAERAAGRASIRVQRRVIHWFGALANPKVGLQSRNSEIFFLVILKIKIPQRNVIQLDGIGHALEKGLVGVQKVPYKFGDRASVYVAMV